MAKGEKVKRLFKKLLPKKIRKNIRFFLLRLMKEEATISEGWELYAQDYKAGTPLGDEWSEPERIGLDVAADEIVPYLDRTVFEPFFGKCDTILEIGAGGGRFSEILLPKCKKLIAADTSESMIKLLKERFTNSDNIEYMLLDGRGLSQVKDNTVDAAFSYGVFVHIQHWDIYNYLTELKRVLKPGGKVIIQHANTFSEKGWQLFLGNVPISLNKHKLWGTFTVMSEELIREFAERAGLKLEKCVTDVAKRDCISLMIAQ